MAPQVCEVHSTTHSLMISYYIIMAK